MTSQSIAVTVLGGYLGAGKTTLLNHLLAHADERVAVLVNDFGDPDIDTQLVDNRDGSTVTLPNGCVCCSLADGLAAALLDVDDLVPRPDRLIIEASGVADPAGVAAYCHRRGFRLDLVVVVADAFDVVRQLDDELVADTVRAQLAAADLIVLNKADLVSSVVLEAGEAAIRRVASHAPLVATAGATVDPSVLLGVEHRSGEPGHLHEHGVPFSSWSYRDDETRDAATITAIAEAFPPGVVRAKGVAAMPDGRRAVLQVAAGRVNVTIDDGPAPAGLELVAIGMADALDDQVLAKLARRR